MKDVIRFISYEHNTYHEINRESVLYPNSNCVDKKKLKAVSKDYSNSGILLVTERQSVIYKHLIEKNYKVKNVESIKHIDNDTVEVKLPNKILIVLNKKNGVYKRS
jgi:hydroxyacyl-ACP dehydratase HTD2-like protein with hotdog domain